MPKVSPEHRTARREQITRAAVRAFRRKGFTATSMADIIAESGASAGAIYGHFRGKAELVHAVASSILDDRLVDVGALLALDPIPSPGELVGVLMRGVLDELEQPALLVQVWGEAMVDPELLALANSIMDRVEGAYRAHISLWQQREHGLPAAAADALAVEQTPLFLAACQGFVLQHAVRPGFDADEYLLSAARHLPR